MEIDWMNDYEIVGSEDNIATGGEEVLFSQEGNNNNVTNITPPPKAGTGLGLGGGLDPKERHKLAERERRKSMRTLFLSLHSLLPHANRVRKEQSAILDEIIKYIPITASRLTSLQNRKTNHNYLKPSSSSSSSSFKKTTTSLLSASSSIQPLSDSGGGTTTTSDDCDIIRIEPEPSSSVSIRVRGERVNVSLIDKKGTTSQTMLLSDLLDEIESHQLEILRSTHCRDGNKVLHHCENKVCDGLDKSPTLLKATLQKLAHKLPKLGSSSSLKRSFDQI